MQKCSIACNYWLTAAHHINQLKININLFSMNYIITYTNHFKIADSIFAFRKKKLFDVTKTPMLKNKIENGGSIGYWLNGKFYSLLALSKMIINEPIDVDVSDLQWYQQEQLNHIFNLK